MRLPNRWLPSLLLGTPIVLLSSIESIAADERADLFERKIRPVLVEHCYSCHSSKGKQIEGGLRLDSRSAAQRGGESGPAVVPGNKMDSLLLSAIRYESLEMPPDRRLAAEVIGDFEKWIELGAFDPREDEPDAQVEQVESQIDFENGRNFWSFLPPQQRVPASPTRFPEWSSSRIDHFVLEKLATSDLRPAASASKKQMLRRLSFDLTGLPPSAELMKQAGEPGNDFAMTEVVDQLLASAAFGEHWARLWLDLMRFADDQAHIVGSNKALFFPNAYLYRDWVIQALNDDLPYDQFIQLQLAADLATPDDPKDDVAMGFIGLGPKYYRRSSPEVMADEWEDRIDVVCRGLLGLTVACARCHDHKYDPIGTSDYYAMAGVFASCEMYNQPLDSDVELDKQGHAKDPAESIHIVRDTEPRDLSIMIRGDVNRLGQQVPRGFLTVLGQGTDASSFQSPTENSGRLELAKRIASVKNPLTARVFVNRIWDRLIGRPLVGTTSNFGSLGERPTHPRLLDDLAIRFMQHDWSLKWLCREIVSSSTYRQSVTNSRATVVDPQNKLLARMNQKRLAVEQWRDSILAAAGQLERRVGGENIDPGDPDGTKRTIYSFASRLKLHPMLALFDYPDPNVHSARRAQTTTAAQKLFLMNSPFVIGAANRLTEHVLRDGSSIRDSLHRIYRALLSRDPTESEISRAIEFLTVDGRNLKTFVHALMMTNETFFVD